jgi:hypothetical protein
MTATSKEAASGLDASQQGIGFVQLAALHGVDGPRDGLAEFAQCAMVATRQGVGRLAVPLRHAQGCRMLSHLLDSCSIGLV